MEHNPSAEEAEIAAIIRGVLTVQACSAGAAEARVARQDYST
jgi:hypothetical protein